MKSTITHVHKEVHTITLNEGDLRSAIQNYVLSQLKLDPREPGEIIITFGQALGNSFAAKVVISYDLAAQERAQEISDAKRLET